MRRVYFGKTASGKTHVCRELANIFKNKKLTVISNIPDISPFKYRRIDNNKKKILFESDDILGRMYEGKEIKGYPFKNVDTLSFSMGWIIEYLMYEGDVLILDDVDNNIHPIVLQRMMDCLSDDGDMKDCWRHVIVSGYSWDLSYLMSDPDSPVYFICKDGNIEKVSGYDRIKQKYIEVVYG